MRYGLGLTALVAIGTVFSGSAAAGPTLLVEAASGRVLYAEDMDDRWHPASLTKIMTAYVVFEALKAGKITLDTKLPYSEAASLQPPSKIGLPVGAELEVGTALKALIIKSANDVAMMLAEGIGGSEAQFVERMNATAQRLGMTRTRFINPNGLPAAEQVTTARDLAMLSRAVLRDFPEYAGLWSESDMRLGRIRLGTHNALLKTYEGTDGMKTGFICDSGYNIVATATRDGKRLLAVVLGESTNGSRNLRTQALLEHGFGTLAWKQVFNPTALEKLPVSADAKEAVSIRNTVMSFECGTRRRAVTQVAKARAKAKQQRQQAAAAKTGGGATAADAKAPGTAPKAAAAGAPAVTKAPAKTAAGGEARPKTPAAAPAATAANKP